MLITLLLFILILGLLIFVHELGHFWVAKRSGVTVHEFAFGFRPRLFSWKRGETEYAINLIPLGGYVRLEGENDDSGKKGSFAAKPPKVRAAVLVAGVVMNLLLAWVLLTVSYGLGAFPISPTYHRHPGVEADVDVIVVSVSNGSPAAQAGLKPGDEVLAVDGQVVTETGELTTVLKEKAGREVVITYRRGEETADVRATPRQDPPAGEGSLGIGTGESAQAKTSWLQAPVVALREVGSEIKWSFIGFAQFVGQLISAQGVSDDATGLIGIGAATGIVRHLGVGTVLQFIALISTNLAVVNILPIAPLDGGHLLFVIIEAIRKKPVKDIYRQWVALAGLAAILLLFVVVTYQDILRFSVIDRLKAIF